MAITKGDEVKAWGQGTRAFGGGSPKATHTAKAAASVPSQNRKMKLPPFVYRFTLLSMKKLAL